MNKAKVPKSLQGVLWSKDVNHLDLIKDKNYIIHQIFSYGNLEDIFWLFKIYSKKNLQNTFINIPYKDYEASRFNFVKNLILDLKNIKLNEQLYVKNTPRIIG